MAKEILIASPDPFGAFLILKIKNAVNNNVNNDAIIGMYNIYYICSVLITTASPSHEGGAG